MTVPTLLHTVVEEDADGEAEADGGDRVEDEVEEQHRRRHVADDGAVRPERHAEEDGDDGDRDEEEDEVLDGPRRPV